MKKHFFLLAFVLFVAFSCTKDGLDEELNYEESVEEVEISKELIDAELESIISAMKNERDAEGSVEFMNYVMSLTPEDGSVFETVMDLINERYPNALEGVGRSGNYSRYRLAVTPCSSSFSWSPGTYLIDCGRAGRYYGEGGVYRGNNFCWHDQDEKNLSAVGSGYTNFVYVRVLSGCTGSVFIGTSTLN